MSENAYTSPHWTAENIEKLVSWWNAGQSANEIAQNWDNAVSRNAVIGKIHRLRKAGVELRSAANFPRLATRPPAKPKREPRMRLPPQYPIQPVKTITLQVVPPTAKPWTQRRFDECSWPISGEGADLIACCQPVQNRWCAEHDAIGSVPLKTSAKELARSVRKVV
jgi:GcrA cell cycle regulator